MPELARQLSVTTTFLRQATGDIDGTPREAAIDNLAMFAAKKFKIQPDLLDPSQTSNEQFAQFIIEQIGTALGPNNAPANDETAEKPGLHAVQ